MAEKNGKLFIVTGPSGVGKGTILAEFFKKNENAKYSISHTTRAPRVGEVDGVHYFFTTKENFKKLIENDEFLEYAQYGENFYGTSKSGVEKFLNQGYDVILEIEVQGAKQVIEKNENAISIFILPPTIKDLELRLKKRNTESDKAIAARIEIAKKEVEESKYFKHKIKNDTVQNALSNLQKIYDSEIK